jgi:hypothetical protein
MFKVYVSDVAAFTGLPADYTVINVLVTFG